MENVSIKGIVIAMVVGLVLDLSAGFAAVPIFAESMSVDALATLEKDTRVLVYALVISALTSILCGYICARYGKLAPYKNAAIFSCVAIALGAVFASYDPVWFDVIGFITTVPAVLLGAHIVARKNA